eukprot:SM000535S17889  [mRNA]  locus=s535:288:2277:+ [translate_table: standard]
MQLGPGMGAAAVLSRPSALVGSGAGMPKPKEPTPSAPAAAPAPVPPAASAPAVAAQPPPPRHALRLSAIAFILREKGAALSDKELESKAESMLTEYLSVIDLKEAVLCVQELGAPAWHPKLVALVIGKALDTPKDKERELLSKLLLHFHKEAVLSNADIPAGVQLTAAQLDDLTYDAPQAPKHLGDLLGQLKLAKAVDMDIFATVCQACEDYSNRRALVAAGIKRLLADNDAAEMEATVKTLDLPALLNDPEDDGLPPLAEYFTKEGLPAGLLS